MNDYLQLGALAVILLVAIREFFAYLKMRNGNGHDGRLEELEKFRTEAEGNHFHDLADIKVTLTKHVQDFNDFRLEVEKRFGRIENKIK